MIEWSARALLGSGCDPIVVAAPPDMLQEASSALAGLGGRVVVVPGGSDRQASVRKALEAVSSPAVLVHDAARPNVSAALIERVLGALGEADAVVPAVPVTETIKQARPQASGVRTIQRSDLYLAQTPQGFATETLRAAHERASADGFSATDDAELVERYGGTCVIVEGDPRNLKVTHDSDLQIAELLLVGAG